MNSEHQFPTWLLYILPFLFFLVQNNKLLVVLFLGVVVLLRFFKVRYTTAIFTLLLLSLPLEHGLRGGMMPVVVPELTNFGLGYSYYIGLSMKFVLLLLASLTIKGAYRQRSVSVLLLAIFLAFSFIQVLLPQLDLNIVFGLSRIIYIFLLFLIVRFSLQQEECKQILLHLLVGWLLFFGFVGSLQFLLQHNLGLYLESGAILSPFGYLTNESSFLYRVSGTMGHPTFFASWLALLLPVGIGQLINQKKANKNYLSYIGITLALLALFATFSRSSWVATGLAGGLFFWFAYQHKLVTKLLANFRWLLFAGVAIILVYGGYFFTRLQSFSYIFSLGSGRGRIELIQESLAMIRHSPWFGIGPNHFTQVMATQNISGAAAYFLYPVHNTWLLFASELGIPAMLLFVAFVAIILRKVPNKIAAFSIWVACLTFLINSQFHTLFSQDPSLDLFIVFLAYLDVT